MEKEGGSVRVYKGFSPKGRQAFLSRLQGFIWITQEIIWSKGFLLQGGLERKTPSPPPAPSALAAFPGMRKEGSAKDQ